MSRDEWLRRRMRDGDPSSYDAGGAHDAIPEPDVMSAGEEIRVLAEIPGARKKDLRIKATENEIDIDAYVRGKKYHRLVELPHPIDPCSIKSDLKNGILQITVRKHA